MSKMYDVFTTHFFSEISENLENLYNDNELYTWVMTNSQVLSVTGRTMFGDLISNIDVSDETKIDEIARSVVLLYGDNWARIFDSLQIEYNPTSDYNEHETVTHSGSDTSQATGTNNITSSSITNSATTFDSATQRPTSQATGNSAGNTSGNSTITHGHIITRNVYGTKANQSPSEILRKEINFRRYYNFTRIFLDDICAYVSTGVWEVYE